MGWANCGEDSRGRPIGYAHEATCDHPGCEKKIDRGLSYACGDDHGAGDGYCEGYFCYEHRGWCDYAEADVCEDCARENAIPDCDTSAGGCACGDLHVAGFLKP